MLFCERGINGFTGKSKHLVTKGYSKHSILEGINGSTNNSSHLVIENIDGCPGNSKQFIIERLYRYQKTINHGMY